MDWRRMLAHLTGTVDQELLDRNEYLLAENRILRSQVKGSPRLTDADRRTLAEIGKRLGRRALAESRRSSGRRPSSSGIGASSRGRSATSIGNVAGR